MIRRIRNRHLFLADAAAFSLLPAIAYVMRLEGFAWSPEDQLTALLYTFGSLPLKLGALMAVGVYSRLWGRATAADLMQLLAGAGVAAVGCAGLGAVILPWSGLTPVRVPLSVLALDGLLVAGSAAGLRLLAQRLSSRPVGRGGAAARRVLVAGAGSAAEAIVRELQTNPGLRLDPVAIVDDDPSKWGQHLRGVPVVGGLESTSEILRRRHCDEVVIAMPSAPGFVVRQVVDAAAAVGVSTRTVPAMRDILTGRVGVDALRKVEVEDLLRRAPVHTDLAAVRDRLAGRTILVTGAGGSIGRELCHQAAAFDPARLVLLGHGENSIFEAQQELRARWPGLELVPVIADVRDAARLRRAFGTHGPDVVLHAAAHKHVPLMEHNVTDAVTTNIIGTRRLIEAALAEGTEQFIHISTDKAVHPRSVMGATKRAAEGLVLAAGRDHGRNFVAVRFGNVLGSRGSVVPTFLAQIQAGGPVTVTHPDMVRFFMTIPEAVELVLQAGALGGGGELFVLDMGEPVRIVDLAADLIRLSGLSVGTDIEIRFVGLRPGERLTEEILGEAETALATAHSKVLRVTAAEERPDAWALASRIERAVLDDADDESLRHLLHELVPEFAAHPRSGRPARERRSAAVAAPEELVAGPY